MFHFPFTRAALRVALRIAAKRGSHFFLTFVPPFLAPATPPQHIARILGTIPVRSHPGSHISHTILTFFSLPVHPPRPNHISTTHCLQSGHHACFFPTRFSLFSHHSHFFLTSVPPVSPQPPSARCFSSNQLTALRMTRESFGTPAIERAHKADQVP